MQIILAKTAGFCFGVDRAVSLVEEAVREDKRVATLGPIIHNRHVIERFTALGVREIAAPEEARPGECVVIRSHGVTRTIMEQLAGMDVEVIDATCPFVKKIHRIISEAKEKMQQPVIIGTRSHPEVQIVQKCPCGWSARPPVRRIYGNLPAKSQKKSVQIAKYLIQYARLRRCVKKKRPNWLRNVMPWWLSATREARIRGVSL